MLPPGQNQDETTSTQAKSDDPTSPETPAINSTQLRSELLRGSLILLLLPTYNRQAMSEVGVHFLQLEVCARIVQAVVDKGLECSSELFFRPSNSHVWLRVTR